MSHHEDFSRLEAIVDKLLSTVDQLRKQNREIKDALRQKEEELRSVRNATDGLQDEREEILSRVNRLIDSIEEWESGQSQVEDRETKEDEEMQAFTMKD